MDSSPEVALASFFSMVLSRDWTKGWLGALVPPHSVSHRYKPLGQTFTVFIVVQVQHPKKLPSHPLPGHSMLPRSPSYTDIPEWPQFLSLPFLALPCGPSWCWHHSIDFIFLSGPQKVSSCKERAQWVGASICLCVWLSRGKLFLTHLARGLRCLCLRAFCASVRLPQAPSLGQSAGVWACVVHLTSSFMALVMLPRPHKEFTCTQERPL